MTHRESPVEIKFGAFDDVSNDQVSQLAGELRSIDGDAVVTGLHYSGASSNAPPR